MAVCLRFKGYPHAKGFLRGKERENVLHLVVDGKTKAVFTLGLDYDRIIIELNMKWVHIN